MARSANSASALGGAGEGREPTQSYKRYALFMITSVYTLNLVDRGLMGLLLQSIKLDLNLNDTQLGFVTGIAFALFYAVLGIPISRLADRGNRVNIAAAAIALWGVTVMACLFVTNFAQLLVARIMAAVGEAGCKPPTYSLLGDYFPAPGERTHAMAVYWMAGSVSVLISFVVGGWLNDQVGWRMTFFLMGIPGLLLAIAVKATLVEPRSSRTRSPSSEVLPSFGAVGTAMWRLPACRHLVAALIIFYAMNYGLWPWYGAFMIRSHGMGTAELGLWLGLIFSICGILGNLLGAHIATGWYRDSEASQLRMAGTTIAFIAPCFAAFLLVPEKHLALIALCPLALVFGMFVAPTYAIFQRLVPGNMRATSIAVLMLLANLIGMGLGPQIVGIASDLLAPRYGADSLRYAMLCMSGLAIWSSIHVWRAASTVGGDIALVEASLQRLAAETTEQ